MIFFDFIFFLQNEKLFAEIELMQKRVNYFISFLFSHLVQIWKNMTDNGGFDVSGDGAAQC